MDHVCDGCVGNPWICLSELLDECCLYLLVMLGHVGGPCLASVLLLGLDRVGDPLGDADTDWAEFCILAVNDWNEGVTLRQGILGQAYLWHYVRMQVEINCQG